MPTSRCFAVLVALFESDHCTGAVCLNLHITDLNIPFAERLKSPCLWLFQAWLSIFSVLKSGL